jgi:diphthamide biosynthesis protein 7
MSSIKTLHEFDTKLCADCVVWCPIKDNEHLLVCTTYQLTDGIKSGSILLFSSPSLNDFILLQTVSDLPGIFDAKWKPQVMTDGKVLLATVDSAGYVSVYSLCSESVGFTKVTSINIFPEETVSPMVLYLDWSPHDTKSLVVTSSNGYVTLINYINTKLSIQQQWKGHSFEAWVACFDENDPNVLYSGGDDSLMKCYDLRMNPITTVWTSTAHSAGVTSFMTSRPNQFSSGSYDEHLKLWDSRMLKPKTPLSELCLEGGVWRTKMSTYGNQQIVIAACMFAGYKLLHWNESDFSLLDTYRSNVADCLAYGVDWSNDNKFAACSFYDHKLMICQAV